ncbi:hypothetical protein [Rubricoccus marinus]|uniref:Uncharacterized protein n=1 Tax=Rubricoccus marinus TaxID=716817 RepID=A0A259U240_9BACT|nr:hypothetical protein [Rubricoccus marinus]OZC04020.1 hypothetical protein BSZ36_14130 [Rubricoccus marinus]
MPKTKTTPKKTTRATPEASGVTAADATAARLFASLPPAAQVVFRRMADAAEKGEHPHRFVGEAAADRIRLAGESPPEVVAHALAWIVETPEVPAWLAEPFDAAGATGGAVDAWRLAGGTDDDAPVGPLLCALAELAQTAPAADVYAESYVPSSQPSRPRLGFVPGASHPGKGASEWETKHWERRRDAAKKAGMTEERRCALTDTVFHIPFGSPVPSLLFDTEDETAYNREDPSAPLRRRRAYTVHPAVFAAGAEAVARAFWQHAHELAYEVGEKLAAAAETVAMARLLAKPDSIGTEPPGSAYVTTAGAPTGWYAPA